MILTTSVLLVLAPLVTQAAVQFTTNGTSGPQCGRYRCLGNDQAVCEDGECVCQGEHSKGLGNFVCLREDEDYAVLFHDPIVRGFDGSITKSPLVCRFLAAHIATKTCTGGTPDNVVTTNGMCDFRFFGWGRRKLGKTFVRGIQMNVVVYVGNVSYHHNTRIEADAFNGQYLYAEDGNTNPFGAPPFDNPVETHIPNLGSIRTFYDNVDNFAIIRAEPCGIEVGIRGVEQVADPLLRPSGMYIKVLRACQPTFLSNESVIFSPPPGHGLSLAQHAQIISQTIGLLVAPKHVIVQRGCSAQQDYPDAPTEIQMLADTVRECAATSVFVALKHCLFMLDIPRFFKCFDKTNVGSLAINLLNMCIFSFCDLNRFMCLNVKSLITESRCHTRIPLGQPTIFDIDCESFDI